MYGGDRRTTVAYEYTPGSYRPVVQDRREWLRDALQHEVDRRFRLIVSDLAGSPTELLSPEGEVTWQSRYTLWGGVAGPDSAATECLIRFSGQYFDAESGLHYNYFRYYDPVAARYLSPDPLGLAAGPEDYAYVVNPTTRYAIPGNYFE